MDSQVNIQNQPKEEGAVTNIIASIKSWFFFFLRKWWIIGLAGLFGGAVGIWIAYKDKASYESRLTFALDDGGTDAEGVSSIAAQFGINIGGTGKSFFSGDNILEIMKSRRIVETVLLSTDTIDGKNERLIQHYLNFNKDESKVDDKTITFLAGTPRSQFTYKQDSVVMVVANTFSTKLISALRPDRRLEIYEVKVTTRNEHFSKVFTDRIVQETINFYTELRIKKSKETLDILEERVASMKGNLNSSISNKSAIQDANLNPAFSAAQVPLQKQNMNIQVYSGAYSEMFKNLELARFQYLKQIPLLQVIDAANYPMKKIKMGRLITGIKYGLLFTFVILILLVLGRHVRGQ